MSQLIKLRHRIKAIETTKKVTHAMRLIAMSSHTQLKGRHEALKMYRSAVHALFKKVQMIAPVMRSTGVDQEDSRPLIIVVGSQKGLCANFNSSLFAFFEKSMATKKTTKHFFIPLGKKAVDFFASHPQAGTVVKSYGTLTINTHLKLARELTDMIMLQEEPYTSVTVFSNALRGFFMQRPMETKLLPITEDFAQKAKKGTAEVLQEEYIWEQSPQELVSVLSQHYFEVSLQYLLFQSLLAEHAARFLSMDSATRNAESLLEKSKINYNKLRQAKITKELAELAGSFQAQ
jgi:F-type H+-transporting ATPase subunit gamma